MTKLYFILSVAGWAWFLVVLVFLAFRFARARKTPPRGFDVIEPQQGTAEFPARGATGDPRA